MKFSIGDDNSAPYPTAVAVGNNLSALTGLREKPRTKEQAR